MASAVPEKNRTVSLRAVWLEKCLATRCTIRRSLGALNGTVPVL